MWPSPPKAFAATRLPDPHLAASHQREHRGFFKITKQRKKKLFCNEAHSGATHKTQSKFGAVCPTSRFNATSETLLNASKEEEFEDSDRPASSPFPGHEDLQQDVIVQQVLPLSRWQHTPARRCPPNLPAALNHTGGGGQSRTCSNHAPKSKQSLRRGKWNVAF